MSVTPRAFVLERLEDVGGVSGTGTVAEGVEFSDGTVALRWTSEWPTSVVFHDRGIESVRAVHGHDGRTRIVWVDGADDVVDGPAAERIDHIPSHISPPVPGYGRTYLTIDRAPYRVKMGTYTGAQIRHFSIPTVDESRDLWLVRPGDSDRRILDEEQVDVSTSGLRFYTTGKNGVFKERHVWSGYVNGRLVATGPSESLVEAAHRFHLDQPDDAETAVAQ